MQHRLGDPDRGGATGRPTAARHSPAPGWRGTRSPPAIGEHALEVVEVDVGEPVLIEGLGVEPLDEASAHADDGDLAVVVLVLGVAAVGRTPGSRDRSSEAPRCPDRRRRPPSSNPRPGTAGRSGPGTRAGTRCRSAPPPLSRMEGRRACSATQPVRIATWAPSREAVGDHASVKTIPSRAKLRRNGVVSRSYPASDV